MASGVFTEQILDRFWILFSNGRHNSGAFYDAFHGDRDSWPNRWNLDIRGIEGISPDMWKNIERKYGKDSDEFRVEVMGLFPNNSDGQYFPDSEVREAMNRPIPYGSDLSELVMGVDVARRISRKANKSVIAFRRGRDARTIPWITHKGNDTIELAKIIANAIDKYDPDGVVIDGDGVGGPLCDILKSWGYQITEARAKHTATDDRCYNKRTENYVSMREDLQNICLPNSQELFDDLTKIKMGMNERNGELQLESKDAMMERGLSSPDLSDALAFTYYGRFVKRSLS